MMFEKLVSLACLGIGSLMGYCSLVVLINGTWLMTPASLLGLFITYKAFQTSRFWWTLEGKLK